MFKDHFWKIFGLLAVLLVVLAFVYGNHVSNKANEGITLTSHIKGNPDAVVSLVEYSDFQCPACQAASQVVEDVLAEHEGKIRFEYKHFPLITIHPHALLAARAAEAAGQQGKFFEMHDALFENQANWSTSPSPQVFFNQYAEEIGLNMDTFKTHMRASMLRDEVLKQYDDARTLGLTGTPSFFLNGQKMTFTTYEDFARQIRQAVTGEVEVTPDAPVSDVQFGL
jgi:protein-disulfide isomerase